MAGPRGKRRRVVVEEMVPEEEEEVVVVAMGVICLPCGSGVRNTWAMAGKKVGGTEWAVLVKAGFVT